MNSIISEFAQHEANSTISMFSGFRTWFRVRAENRKNRAAFQHLLELDDAMLADIGVTRGDVAWANALPLSQNASLELQKIANIHRGSFY